MEGAAVLHRHAYAPAALQNFVQGNAVSLAPAGAVDEEHIGALGLLDGDPGEVTGDKGAGVVHILREHLPQLLQPFIALRLIGPQKGIHTHQVHFVEVGQGLLLLEPVPEPGVIDNGIAAHQSCQIEGLAGGVHGGSAHLRVLGDGLGGDVLVA